MLYGLVHTTLLCLLRRWPEKRYWKWRLIYWFYFRLSLCWEMRNQPNQRHVLRHSAVSWLLRNFRSFSFSNFLWYFPAVQSVAVTLCFYIEKYQSRQIRRILTNYKQTKVQTIQATTYAAGIFHKYCILRNGYNNAYVIDTLAANTLDSLLESFYAEAWNKKGENTVYKPCVPSELGLKGK